MVWSWAHNTTSEYHHAIVEQLQTWDKNELIKAYEDIIDDIPQPDNVSKRQLANDLYRHAYNIDLCTNGAHKVYLDDKGYYRVNVPE